MGGREAAREALTGARAGQPLSGERLHNRSADVIQSAEGNTVWCVNASTQPAPRHRRPWHARMSFAREPRGLRTARGCRSRGRTGRHDAEAGDAWCGEVRPAGSTDEAGEQGGPTRGGVGGGKRRDQRNARLQSTVRTQSREAVSQAQSRIREAVTRNKKEKLTALLHHISVDALR